MRRALNFTAASARLPRCLRRIVLALLSMAGLMLIALPTIGMATSGTIRASLALALMPASALVSLALLLAQWGERSTLLVAQRAWHSAAIFAFGFSLYIALRPEADAQKAADTILVLSMLLLSAPTGLIALVFVYLYSMVFLSERPAAPAEFALFWIAFYATGYVQWFKLIPWIAQAIASWRRGSLPPRSQLRDR